MASILTDKNGMHRRI